MSSVCPDEDEWETTRPSSTVVKWSESYAGQTTVTCAISHVPFYSGAKRAQKKDGGGYGNINKDQGMAGSCQQSMTPTFQGSEAKTTSISSRKIL